MTRLIILYKFLAFSLLILYANESCYCQVTIQHLNTDNELPSNYINNFIFDDENNLILVTNLGLYIKKNNEYKKLRTFDLSPRWLKIMKFNNQLLVFNLHNKSNIYEIKHSVFHLTNLKVKMAFDVEQVEMFHDYFQYTLDSTSLWIDTTATPKHKPHFFHLEGMKFAITKNELLSFPDNVSFKNVKCNFSKSELSNIYQYGLLFSSHNEAFVLYCNTIFQLNFDSNYVSFSPVLQDVNLSKEVNNLNCGAYDKNSNTFIFSSQLNGLFLVKPRHFQNPICLSFNPHSNVFYGQMLIDSKIYTSNGSIFGLKNGSLTCSHKDYLPHQNFHALYRDPWGNVFIKEKKIKISNNPALEIDIEKNNIYQHRIQLSDSILYITLGNKFAVFEINYKNRKAHILFDTIISDILHFEHIFLGNKKKELNNNLLFLSSTHGMYVFDGTKNLITKTKFPSFNYRGIYPTNNNQYLVTSYGNGLFALRDDTLISLNFIYASNLTHPHYVISDSLGYLWIPTNNGLYQVKESEVTRFIEGHIPDIPYYYYDKSYGFASNEFNGGPQDCGIKTPEGLISLSSMKGLVIFDPKLIKPDWPKNPISLWSVSDSSDDDSFITDTLHLDPNTKLAKIKVHSAYFGLAQNIHIQYRIKELFKEWINVNNSNIIEIFRKSPGTFMLEVRIRKGFEYENYSYKSIFIYIPLLWYETTWFYTTVCLLVFLILYVVVYISNKNTLRKNKKLKQILHEHTQLLQESNNELQLNINFIKNINAALAHDVKAPIGQTLILLKDFIEHWIKINDQKKLSLINTIYNVNSNVNFLLQDYLQIIKIKESQNLKYINVELYKIVNEVIELHRISAITSSNIYFTNKIDPTFTLFSEPVLIKLIFTNLLDNSIKGTKNGSISFYIDKNLKDPYMVTIVCHDQGNGISKDKIKILSNLHYYNENENKGYSLGYMLVHFALKLLNGYLSIESDGNSFTKVFINIPILKNKQVE